MMTIHKEQDLQPSRDQIIYANILVIGVWSGIVILITTYVIYLSGLLPSHIEISTIPKM